MRSSPNKDLPAQIGNESQLGPETPHANVREKLSLLERVIEHTTINFDVAKVLLAIAAIILAYGAPKLATPLIRLLLN